MKKSFEFLKKFKIINITTENLISAIETQGFTIVEYSRISNSDDVEKLLIALGVKALSLTTGAFTYADSNYRIVFIEEGLSDEEKLILLAHEEGHIFCGHLHNNYVISGDAVIKEFEANEFAHSLLKKDIMRSVRLWINFNKVKTLTASVVVIMLATVITFGSLYFYKHAHKDEFCRTRSGYHYHKPGCETIENFIVTYDSKENYEKIGIEPCSVCLPEIAK